MATTRNNDRVRYRYGICLNDSCQKCKTKEVQQIAARKELVCEECGKPLRECPPPVQKNNMKLYGGIAAAVLILGGGAAALFSGGGDEAEKPAVEAVDTVKVDSAKVEAPAPAPAAKPEAKPEAKPAEKPAEKPAAAPAPKPASGKNPSWGRYEGKRNSSGLADGTGVVYITKPTTINGEQAQPGERIEGVFRNGYVNMGSWFKKDGNVVVIKDLKVM